jgi:hypothetical protein
MYDGAAKLKSLGWFISDDLLMDFIMVSLPARYKKCTHNAHILKVCNFRKNTNHMQRQYDKFNEWRQTKGNKVIS